MSRKLPGIKIAAYLLLEYGRHPRVDGGLLTVIAIVWSGGSSLVIFEIVVEIWRLPRLYGSRDYN
jgi:hypothetical protein